MDIKWAPRLRHEKLRRLYISFTSGLVDENLLEDVAVTLYLRCKDIIAVEFARKGNVRCPCCYEKGEENYIRLEIGEDSKLNDDLHCTHCGVDFSYAEYRKCYKHEQLNMGGAGDAFRRFIREYEIRTDIDKRMLQIDRLIHEFHYSLKAKPDQPCRSVGPNLLDLRLTDAIKFLNDLSGLCDNNEEMKKTAELWTNERKKMDETWMK